MSSQRWRGYLIRLCVLDARVFWMVFIIGQIILSRNRDALGSLSTTSGCGFSLQCGLSVVPVQSPRRPIFLGPRICLPKNRHVHVISHFVMFISRCADHVVSKVSPIPLAFGHHNRGGEINLVLHSYPYYHKGHQNISMASIPWLVMTWLLPLGIQPTAVVVFSSCS